MHVFITGASGWIGSAPVDELLAASHDLIGLVRSDKTAAALEVKGAKTHRGDLDDLDSLRRGAVEADAVVHLAIKRLVTPGRVEPGLVGTVALAELRESLTRSWPE